MRYFIKQQKRYVRDKNKNTSLKTARYHYLICNSREVLATRKRLFDLKVCIYHNFCNFLYFSLYSMFNFYELCKYRIKEGQSKRLNKLIIILFVYCAQIWTITSHINGKYKKQKRNYRHIICPATLFSILLISNAFPLYNFSTG